VACDSKATRREVLDHHLMTPGRTTVIWNGVSLRFTPEASREDDREAARLIGERQPEAIEILHVGSTIPRKRIDVLLRVFAGIREEFREARLIRVSGPFTSSQVDLLHELGLEGAVTVLPFISTAALAALYRRASLVLIPSEAEGFGLPVAEAMACGTTVIASALPALREVGGDAALFAPAGNTAAMTTLALQALRHRQADSAACRRQRSIENAARFSWTEYARRYVELYQSVHERSG
jgi:glycosyltransferase involved in cell wall biosynthesis